MENKKIYIITGGTINKVAPHFAIAAPAYGEIGEKLYKEISKAKELNVNLIKTKMADPKFYHSTFQNAEINCIETNKDLRQYISWLNHQKDTECIILACAVADFEIELPAELSNSRLSSNNEYTFTLKPSEKILPLIREDVFTISFKTLYNEENESKALKNSDISNVVFVNDIGFKKNGIVYNNKLEWNISREESIKIAAMHVFNHFDLVNRKCYGCGLQTPESFNHFINNRCDCGSKKNTCMAFKTILKIYHKQKME
jgi:hypothetical protein